MCRLVGLDCCFTPVRSPESNGMAESFVKTFKRDYVLCHDHPNASSVLSQLEMYFRGYNEVAPHKSLGIRSPRQFIRERQQKMCPVLKGQLQ